MNYQEAKKAKNAVESRPSLFSFVKKFFNKIFRRKNMKELYVYLFVRQDLSLAQQNVQSIHAGIKAGETFGKGIGKANLVYIGVPYKEDLHEVMDIMGRNEIPFVEFYEPDYDEGLTAVCTDILCDRKKRALFQQFDLWQPPPELALT